MALSKRKRFEVFKRDSFACQYCGRTPPVVILHVDHVIPRAGGGGDDETNLITACDECNIGKSDVPLGQVIQSVQEMAEKAKEKREQIEAYNQLQEDGRQFYESSIQRIGGYWYDNLPYQDQPGEWVFGPSRKPTIRRFLERLTETEIIEAIDITLANMARTSTVFKATKDENGFRYFCAVCWNKYREAK